VVHYFDNAATTPLKPEVLEAMMPALVTGFGNPSGSHKMARAAMAQVDDAQELLAGILGVEPSEIVFTSGGTEADNLAINGVSEFYKGRPACSAIEHHAVLNPVEKLGGQIIGVNAEGFVNPESVNGLDDDISILSVMAANNETGVIQPVSEISEILKEQHPDVKFHVDAVQAHCWLDLKEICSIADLVSISAHKFGGPKGVGALIVKRGVKFAPQQLGGSQERGKRAGTHNVAGIIGLAEAAKLTEESKLFEIERVKKLRNRLSDGVLSKVENTTESGLLNGSRSNKLPNISHLCFDGIESEALLFLLENDGIMASAAASCSSGALEPSHVLAAMGYPRMLAGGSLRLSLGYQTTDEDVDVVLDVLPKSVAQIRKSS